MVEILSDVQKENTSPQPQPQQQQYQNTIIEENKASTLPSPSKPPRYLSLNRYRSQRSSDEDAENNIPMADSSSSSPTMEQKFPPK
uniref:Uncharacterized protein n=1 Tax=Panagrolaimus superbus TaxID=310955 RepID=A0A914YS63_9BILA